MIILQVTTRNVYRGIEYGIRIIDTLLDILLYFVVSSLYR
jgi:hypothetical protein